MQLIKDACDGRYKAAHDSGPRTRDDIKYVVIHSTEGDTAEGAAAWFANPRSEGSANLVVDDTVCYRTVADLRIPWAAPPLNTKGFHIELAGHAAWSRTRWLNQGLTLQRAAYKTAHRCFIYGIPVRQVGSWGLRLGRKGITSHNAVSKAWGLSNHTDPGPGFPWDQFMGLVKRYYSELQGL